MNDNKEKKMKNFVCCLHNNNYEYSIRVYPYMKF